MKTGGPDRKSAALRSDLQGIPRCWNPGEWRSAQTPWGSQGQAQTWERRALLPEGGQPPTQRCEAEHRCAKCRGRNRHVPGGAAQRSPGNVYASDSEPEGVGGTLGSPPGPQRRACFGRVRVLALRQPTERMPQRIQMRRACVSGGLPGVVLAQVTLKDLSPRLYSCPSVPFLP